MGAEEINQDLIDSTISPGKMLSAKREAMGLNQEQVADSLKISLKKLIALEQDDYESFPSLTYVRGYLRNYIRLVELREEDVMPAFKGAAGTSSSVTPYTPESMAAAPKGQHKQWWIVYTSLVVIVLAWAGSYWFLNLSGFNEESPAPAAETRDLEAELQPPVTDEAQQLDTNESSSNEASLLDSASLIPGTEEQDSLIGEETQTEAITAEEQRDQMMLASKLTASELIKVMMPLEPSEEEQSLEEAVDLAGNQLVFQFVNECWVEVSDASGKPLFRGLQAAGARLELSGDPPFRAVLGNVTGVSIALNGEPVSMPAPRSNNSLRFTIEQ